MPVESNISPDYLAAFEARTKQARAACEPEMRRLLAEWDQRHSGLDGGGAPSMLRAMAGVIGRCCGEMLPPDVAPSEAFDLLARTIHSGMLEVLSAAAHGSAGHA